VIGVRSLAYDGDTGTLTVTFADEAGSRIVVRGWLGAQPQPPQKNEMLRWDLLLRAEPDQDNGGVWATLSVERPPQPEPRHPYRPQWEPWM
jgi:hypothetical protein